MTLPFFPVTAVLCSATNGGGSLPRVLPERNLKITARNFMTRSFLMISVSGRLFCGSLKYLLTSAVKPRNFAILIVFFFLTARRLKTF